MDEKRITQSVLLDFYGELLTEKQRECFDLHCNEDLSLSEIAEQSGISRQGVWENIRRAEAQLNEYEKKTGIVSKFSEIRRLLEDIREDVRCMEPRAKAEQAAAKIDELLEKL